MKHNLLKRRDATANTKSRFIGPDFRLGHWDCVRMVAFHIRQFGYKVRLPSAGSYRTVKSATKALQSRGFADLLEALDDMGLERIAPAAALVGDIIMSPGEGAFGGGLQIYVGNGRTLGYHEDAASAVILQPIDYVAAWRV